MKKYSLLVESKSYLCTPIQDIVETDLDPIDYLKKVEEDEDYYTYRIVFWRRNDKLDGEGFIDNVKEE